MSDAPGTLRVEADLTLTVDGETATASTGPFGDVYVDAPSLASALRIARRVGDGVLTAAVRELRGVR